MGTSRSPRWSSPPHGTLTPHGTRTSLSWHAHTPLTHPSRTLHAPITHHAPLTPGARSDGPDRAPEARDSVLNAGNGLPRRGSSIWGLKNELPGRGSSIWGLKNGLPGRARKGGGRWTRAPCAGDPECTSEGMLGRRVLPSRRTGAMVPRTQRRASPFPVSSAEGREGGGNMGSCRL